MITLFVTREERNVIDETAQCFLGGVGYDQWVAAGTPAWTEEAVNAYRVFALVGPALEGAPRLELPDDPRALAGLRVLRDYEAGGIPDEERALAERAAHGEDAADTETLLARIRRTVAVLDGVAERFTVHGATQEVQ